MNTNFFIPRCAGFLILILLALPGVSDEADVRKLESNGKIMKLSQVIEQINKTSPGRVLEVQLNKMYGKYIYEIDMLDHQGILWEYKLDAKSGELIEKQKEK